MDGVLIDSGAHHRKAWRALLDELRVEPAHPEFWRLTIGRPAEEALPLLLGRRVSRAEARRLARRKRDLYAKFAARGLEPVAGGAAGRALGVPTAKAAEALRAEGGERPIAGSGGLGGGSIARRWAPGLSGRSVTPTGRREGSGACRPRRSPRGSTPVVASRR